MALFPNHQFLKLAIGAYLRLVVSYQTGYEGVPQQGLRWLQWSQSSSSETQWQLLPVQALLRHHHSLLFSARNTSAVSVNNNGLILLQNCSTVV